MTDEQDIDLDRLAREERVVRQGLWDKLRRAAGRIDFAREAVAAWYCAIDPATPLRVKAILVGALAYFVLPFDVIPDFILGLGLVDDATVFWTAWRAVRSDITDAHRQRAAAAFAASEEEPPVASPPPGRTARG